jgi:hypothetical protein
MVATVMTVQTSRGGEPMKWMVTVTVVAALAAGCGGAKKAPAETMEEYGYTATQIEIYVGTLTQDYVKSRGATKVCDELYEQQKDNYDFPEVLDLLLGKIKFTNGCLNAMLDEGWGKLASRSGALAEQDYEAG